MPTEPRWDMTLTPGEVPERVARFPGELRGGGALSPGDSRRGRAPRGAAEPSPDRLAEATPPQTPEHWDDILLVVTELAANAVQYAPGPFELRMRRTSDGVHVVLHD